MACIVLNKFLASQGVVGFETITSCNCNLKLAMEKLRSYLFFVEAVYYTTTTISAVSNSICTLKLSPFLVAVWLFIY